MSYELSKQKVSSDNYSRLSSDKSKLSQPNPVNMSEDHLQYTQQGQRPVHRSHIDDIAPNMILRLLDRIGHYSAFLTEFMGTFFLVLTIGCVSIAKSPLAPIAIGSVLMACVFMGGHISGGHYNPAVTLGVYLTGRGKITFVQSCGYMIAQLAGSFVAALTYWNVLGDTFHLEPGTGISNGEAVSVEFLYTFLLVSVVLNVATTKAQADNHFYGLAIGFTVVAAAASVGPLSGGAFNPAVGFGPVIVDIMHNTDQHTSAWVYWVGPFLGSFVAAIGFRVTNHHKEYNKVQKENMAGLYAETEEALVPETEAI